MTFVRTRGGQYASLGIGKLVGRIGASCSVEFFDLPMSEVVVRNFESKNIEEITLPKYTRVFHFDETTGRWETGQLLEDNGDHQVVQFPDGKTKKIKLSAVYVRWAKPIVDPTPLLQNRIIESPRFSNGRSAFLRSQTQQRAACMGISALLSCAVELEAHQVEVVRRILQDPVQRYLLADEVGLGKTIEAGVLIRQCMLDMEQNCTILVIVPHTLIGQWRTELRSKFFLENQIDISIHVVGFGDVDIIRKLLPKAVMLVIDEAHHLTERSTVASEEIYMYIARAARSVERVLLLSATPALHNERGFLRMLHILDPVTYSLDGEESFRRKVENRQAVAEIVAGLCPENALYLDYTIEQIERLFPDDEILTKRAAELRAVVATMPDEGDPALVDAIGQMREHLSEIYRLDRRILRHRRRSIGRLTPGRSGASIVRYFSSDRAALTVAMEEWRFEEALNLDATGTERSWHERVRAFWQVLERSSQYASSGPGIIGFLTRKANLIGNQQFFNVISRCLARPGLFDDRAQALVEVLGPLLRTGAQCIVFCSDVKTADALARRIEGALGIAVVRHNPQDTVWSALLGASDHPILVCDQRAEEGLNLQGGNKVVVHYDLPLNPNRIEQRIGRADRYGSGEAIRSVVLACEDDPFEMAWVSYLDTALRVFERSVASLQYLIEQTVSGAARSLFTDGADALIDLTVSSRGDKGLIEREIKAIDQQDALDSLGRPPTDLLAKLSAVDADWAALARDSTVWLEEMLQFGRFEEPAIVGPTDKAVPFRYIFSTSDRPTLVPKPAFEAQCAAAIDLPRTTRFGREIRTIPYTFRRRTAVVRAARAKGVGLLRYGDAFVTGIAALTDLDDRGRSFAMWRFVPDYVSERVADVFFRFDFVLEADVEGAIEILQHYGRDGRAARAAVRRRADMALAPSYRSIWLDSELKLVEEEPLRSRLASAYLDHPDRHGAFDLNLSPQRWQRLLKLQLPELDYWADLCSKSRVSAERTLLSDLEVNLTLAEAERRSEQLDRGRLSQLRARWRSSMTVGNEREIAFEEQLAKALRGGVRTPRARLDTIGAVFVSNEPSVTNQIASGA